MLDANINDGRKKLTMDYKCNKNNGELDYKAHYESYDTYGNYGMDPFEDTNHLSYFLILSGLMVFFLNIGLRLIKDITVTETKNFIQFTFLENKLKESFSIFDIKKLHQSLSNARVLYNCYLFLSAVIISFQYLYFVLVHNLRFNKFVQIKFNEYQQNLLKFTRTVIETKCTQTNTDNLLLAHLTNDFMAYSRVCDLNTQIFVIINLFYQLMLGILIMHLALNLIFYRFRAFRYSILFCLFPKLDRSKIESLIRPDYFFPITYLRSSISKDKLDSLIKSLHKQIIKSQEGQVNETLVPKSVVGNERLNKPVRTQSILEYVKKT